MKAARRLALLALLANACGDSSPSVPTPPAPTPTPTPRPATTPGVLKGSYILKVDGAPECSLSQSSISFPVQVNVDDGRYPGVQGTDSLPVAFLELELLDGGATVRGSIGTAGGIRADSGIFVWFELVATGDVTVTADGVGEVLTGTAAGFVELGANPNNEGGFGSCKSVGHTWTLRRP
jgi:hypothetical protein